MKFLIFADIHCGVYSQYDYSGSRLANTINCLFEIYQQGYKHKVDAILFGGDLFDIGRNPPAVVVNLVAGVMARVGDDIPMYAISGNHDLYNHNTDMKEGPSILNYLDTCIPYFNLIDRLEVEIGKWTIYGVPYFKHAEHFKKHVQSLEPGMDKILLTHQNPPNYFMNRHFEVSDVSQFGFVFNGHIHEYSQFGQDMFCIGSPLHRDQGDIGDKKGYLIFEDGVVTRHYLNFPEFSYEDTPGNYYVEVPVVDTPELSGKSFRADITPQSLVHQYWEQYSDDESLLKTGLLML